MDGSEMHPSSDQLADSGIFEAFLQRSLGRWGSGKIFGAAKIKTRGAHEDVNCQTMRTKLSAKIENSGIIPPYSEYMETAKIKTPRFATMGVCLVYEPGTPIDGSGRNTKHVAKKPSNNI